jgi:hypothetical protein
MVWEFARPTGVADDFVLPVFIAQRRRIALRADVRVVGDGKTRPAPASAGPFVPGMPRKSVPSFSFKRTGSWLVLVDCQPT